MSSRCLTSLSIEDRGMGVVANATGVEARVNLASAFAFLEAAMLTAIRTRHGAEVQIDIRAQQGRSRQQADP